MLRELAVQNLALIEDVRVELQPGFCAWTGETGAGKTLLLSALGLLLGERASADLLRAGADEMRVVGRFDLTRPGLKESAATIVQIALEDDEIILLRRQTAAGRSFAYVNEQPVSLATLRQLGQLLVDVHGQRESLSLLEPSYQLQLLDAFGNLEELRGTYINLAAVVRDKRRRLQAFQEQRQQRLRELALVRFEREELDAAQLVAGEIEELSRRRERLQHAQALQDFAAAACGRLYDEEGSLFEQLGKWHREAVHWQTLDAGLADVGQRLHGLAAETRDVAETLRELSQLWQADPAQRDEVDNRLQLLRKLETKYGRPLHDLIAYRQTLDDQETRLQKEEEDQTGTEQELAAAFAQLRETARVLSKQRQRICRRLATAVQKELADLGMAEAQLSADLTTVPLGDDPLHVEVPADGQDKLVLTLAANPGEPALPLRKVASGGELSRTMLALKTVLAAHDQVETLIFDEIDANVGGRLGDVLGTKLAALGKSHQVICVTHLPQVASYARHQWSIRKQRQGKRTLTTITPLVDSERVEELASMLRGAARADTTRQEVAAMLAAARKKW